MAFVTFKSDLVKLVIFHFDLVATPRSNRTKNNSTKRKLLLKLAQAAVARGGFSSKISS